MLRAGSSGGRVLVDGQRETVTRPRVRQHEQDGLAREVPLATYQSANNADELQASILTALTGGVFFQPLGAIQTTLRRSFEFLKRIR